MTVLIKLIYAGAIAALLVLSVAFGIRTFYGPPEEPDYPRVPASFRPPIPVGPGVDPASPQQPTPEQLAFEAEQQRYQDAFDRYMKQRADYRSRVFIVAALVGIAAIAGGLRLPSRLDAIRLGLISGGVGTLLYAVIQAGEDLDEIGAVVVFLVVVAGLALVVAAGYRWLAARDDA